ncbi:hypothetical protein ATCVMN08101_336R [Acanthocystis turfacea Chlorella virus MN0810.1]|nr:hypothetical protein ATCVMN08101_336R [Acanthocystis turfacea Chlorella virus MN0810.1]
MCSIIKNSCTPFGNFFAEHHRTMLKRDIPLNGDDAEISAKAKVDNATVLGAFRDFFKTHNRVMVKRGIIASHPGDGTFVENGATKHKEDGVVVVETSEKIQDA